VRVGVRTWRITVQHAFLPHRMVPPPDSSAHICHSDRKNRGSEAKSGLTSGTSAGRGPSAVGPTSPTLSSMSWRSSEGGADENQRRPRDYVSNCCFLDTSGPGDFNSDVHSENDIGIDKHHKPTALPIKKAARVRCPLLEPTQQFFVPLIACQLINRASRLGRRRLEWL